jgi:hypothetical protein
MALGLYDPKNPRRTYGGEEAWFGLLEELGHSQLRQAFIAAGESPAQAGNLVFFIEEQMTLRRHFSKPGRNRYRHVLAELDPEKVRKLAATIPGWFNSDRAA